MQNWTHPPDLAGSLVEGTGWSSYLALGFLPPLSSTFLFSHRPLGFLFAELSCGLSFGEGGGWELGTVRVRADTTTQIFFKFLSNLIILKEVH